jgi:predicted DNA binding CopG/RHH family protein
MNKPHKAVPQFKSEEEEREFWTTHDSADFIEWEAAVKNPSLPNLKPSTKTISIRLPESLIHDLKRLANKQDVPYQSLVKTYLSQRVKEDSR